MTRDELLRKWVEALESGKYAQAKYALRRDDFYCCLGVVCDLSGRGVWVENPAPRHGDDGSHLFEVPDSPFAQEYGLPESIYQLLTLSGDAEKKLWTANDEGESFQQIAQRIRAMFPDVFATVPA